MSAANVSTVLARATTRHVLFTEPNAIHCSAATPNEPLSSNAANRAFPEISAVAAGMPDVRSPVRGACDSFEADSESDKASDCLGWAACVSLQGRPDNLAPDAFPEQTRPFVATPSCWR